MDAKKLAVAYAMFLAFTLLTALVVRPMVRSANVPLLKDVL